MSEMSGSGPSDHVGELLPSVALGVASGEERAQVEHHLAACARCRQEMEAHREVAVRLRAEPGLPVPSPALWERVERDIAAGESGHAARQRSRGRPGWSAAAAIAIIAGVSGVLGGLVAERLSDDDSGIAGLEDIATGDVVFTLATSDPALEASGRIFMSTDRTRGVVAVTGLRQLDDDETYAVWLVKSDDSRENVGTFTVDAGGTSIAALSLPYLPGDWDRSGAYVALSISRVSRTDPSTPVGGPVMWGPIY